MSDPSKPAPLTRTGRLSDAMTEEQVGTCIFGTRCKNTKFNVEVDLHLTQSRRLEGYKLSICPAHYASTVKWLESGPGADGETRQYWSAGWQRRDDDDIAEHKKWFDRFWLMLAVLADRRLFYYAMSDFNVETTYRMQGDLRLIDPKKTDRVPLTATLQTYEGLCWFAPQKKIMSGVLSAEEFFDSIRAGNMVKDPGPGPRHGEVSHRIQWHYLMRIMTDSFTQPLTDAWGCTPFELFTQLVDHGLSRNVWGACLEGNDLTAKTPGDPNWINSVFMPWGHTELALNTMLEAQKAADRFNYPMNDGGMFSDTPFGRAVTSRFDTRQTLHQQLTDFGNSWGEVLGIAGVHSYKNQGTRNGRIARDQAGVDYAATHIINWLKAGLPDEISRVLDADDIYEAYEALEEAEIKARVGARRLEKMGTAPTANAELTRANKPPRDAKAKDKPFTRLAIWVSKPDYDKRLAFWFWVFKLNGDYTPTYRRARVGEGSSQGMLLHGRDGLITDFPAEERLEASNLGLNGAYTFVAGQGATVSPDWQRNQGADIVVDLTGVVLEPEPFEEDELVIDDR